MNVVFFTRSSYVSSYIIYLVTEKNNIWKLMKGIWIFLFRLHMMKRTYFSLFIFFKNLIHDITGHYFKVFIANSDRDSCIKNGLAFNLGIDKKSQNFDLIRLIFI